MSQYPPPPYQGGPQQPYPQQGGPGGPYPQSGYPQQGGYPPAGGPPMAPAGKVRPGLGGVWLGVALIVLSGIAGIALIVFGAKSVMEGSGPTQMGNTAVVSLDSGATGTIMVEEGASGACTVTGPGGTVNTSPMLGSANITINNTTWTARETFTAPSNGSYRVECSGSTGATFRVSTVSVGGAVGGIGGGILVGGLGFLIGLILIIVTLVRRSSAKKRMMYGR